MWLLVAREPRPDARYWSGRRWLAAVDAVAWPLIAVLLIQLAPQPVGIVGPMVLALAMLFALGRLYRAIWLNHRYWFTTWRWGRIAVALMVVGWVLKLALPH